jgi:hypothetical protein
MEPGEIGHPSFVRTRKLTEHPSPRTMAQRKECLIQRRVHMLTHKGEYYGLDSRKVKGVHHQHGARDLLDGSLASPCGPSALARLLRRQPESAR